MDTRIQRRQHKQLHPMTFAPVHWQPQVHVTFTRDVTGWLHHQTRVRYHFRKGQQATIDEQHAIEFIVKGYATGRLPRHVSDDERAELHATMTTVGLGNTNQTRST